MDYRKLEEAITERTKAVKPVDIGGIMCDYDTIFEVVNSKKHLFQPSNRTQEAIGRVIIIADGAHFLVRHIEEGAVEKLQILHVFHFMQ